MRETKLVFVAINPRNTEMSYISTDIFGKLMGAGFLRWDGLWIQDARLWEVFFRGLADGRVNSSAASRES